MLLWCRCCGCLRLPRSDTLCLCGMSLPQEKKKKKEKD